LILIFIYVPHNTVHSSKGDVYRYCHFVIHLEQKYSPDVVARDGLVAAHPDDGLRDEGSIPGQLSDGELIIARTKILT
jgi:hypothetical protein